MKNLLIVTAISLIGANVYAASDRCADAINDLSAAAIQHGTNIEVYKANPSSVEVQKMFENSSRDFSNAMTNAKEICK